MRGLRRWALDHEVGDDVRALAFSASVLLVFLVSKSWLLAKFLLAGTNPLADIPTMRLPLIVGSDVLAASLVAPVLFLASGGGTSLRRWLAAPAAALSVALHLGAVLISVVSLKINARYGYPLNFNVFDWVTDLDILGSSAWDSLDRDVIPVAALGLLLLAAVPRLQAAVARTAVRRVTLWGLTGLLVAGLALLSGRALKGYESSGLKSNPVIELARSFRLRPPAPDFPRERDQLATLLPADRDVRRAPVRAAAPERGFPELVGAAQGMNLVLVVLEGCPESYLDARTAPNLERLRQRGLSFRRHQTTDPFTFQSHYALLYSDEVPGVPMELRRLYGGTARGTSLAEEFKARGYRTGVFHSSYTRFIDMQWIWDRGFDRVVGAETLADARRPGWSWGVPDRVTAEVAATFVRESAGTPFFLVYSPIAGHHPYHAPDGGGPFSNSSVDGRFRNAIHYVDATVGSLVAELERQGVAERTVVAVVSDHGETVTQDGGHGLRFSREELVIPWLISNPAIFRFARSSALRTNHLDFAPTMAALFGIALRPEWTGRTMLAPEVPPRLLYWGFGLGLLSAVTDGDLGYVVHSGGAPDRLYRLAERGFEPLALDSLPADQVARYADAARFHEQRVRFSHLQRALEKQSAVVVQRRGGGGVAAHPIPAAR